MFIQRVSSHGASLAVTIVVAWLRVTYWLQRRWQRARASGDTGSETVEKAVIVAVVLGLAVGLTAAIAAVVNQYRGQISP